jgi:hypothetical protein
MIADIREPFLTCHGGITGGCIGTSRDRLATTSSVQGADLMALPP